MYCEFWSAISADVHGVDDVFSRAPGQRAADLDVTRCGWVDGEFVASGERGADVGRAGDVQADGQAHQVAADGLGVVDQPGEFLIHLFGDAGIQHSHQQAEGAGRALNEWLGEEVIRFRPFELPAKN